MERQRDGLGSLVDLLSEPEQEALLTIDRLATQLRPDGRHIEQAGVAPRRLLDVCLTSPGDYMAHRTPQQDAFFTAVSQLRALGLVVPAYLTPSMLPQYEHRIDQETIPVEIQMTNGVTAKVCRGILLGGNLPTPEHVPPAKITEAEHLTHSHSRHSFLPWRTGGEVRISVYAPDGSLVAALATEAWIGWQLTTDGTRVAAAIRRIRKGGDHADQAAKAAPHGTLPSATPADPPATQAGTVPSGSRCLPRCHQKAYEQYSNAIEANPTLKANDNEVYEHLKTHAEPGDDLPDIGTWKRYLRAARKAYGTQKHQPRLGNPSGGSIRRQSEI